MSKPRSHQLDIYGAWLHLATDRKAWRKLRRRIDSLPTLEAGMLLDHIGQEYDGESEALAYLVGFVAAWLHEGINLGSLTSA